MRASSGCARAVNPLELVELLPVHFGIRAEEVQMRTQRLPLALGLDFLLCQLVTLPFMDVKNLDLHVLGALRQVGEHGSSLAEIPDHVAADIATEDRARQRVLEQDFYHLCTVS